VGIKNGKVVVTEEVSTTGEPASIELVADRTNLIADKRDVAHITARILDAHGRVVPVADNEISFEIKGEGKIIGADNGNPFSHEDFKGSNRKAFNGLCLAIVQSSNRSGLIQLTATSPGLKACQVSIKINEVTKGI
jgi:beta-galactosidase